MQVFKEIQSTDYMSRSREVINNNFKSVAGQFSGDAFPTANLVPHMKCWRTDQNKQYQLEEDMVTWRETMALIDGKAYIPFANIAETAKKATGDSNGKDITSYVSGVEIKDYQMNVVFGDGKVESVAIPKVEYSVMTGASESTTGASGLVPSPKAGDDDAILHGDGTWKNLKNLVLDLAHPVGSYYWSTNETNPSVLFGGTWVQVKDKFIYAAGRYKVGAIGGSETVTLTVDQTPAHTHTRGTMDIIGRIGGAIGWPSRTYANGAFYWDGADGQTDNEGDDGINGTVKFEASRAWTGETSSVGGGQPHNNMPPYEVAYCWKRTA